jgi:quercetin dioxygenase-like cupin family protein
MSVEINQIFEVAPIHDVSMNGVYFQIFHANIGEGVNRHDHPHGHATMCHAGKILVSKDGVQLYMDKNTPPVLLKGGSWHQIEAIEDGTVFVNVFAMKDWNA